jgi:2-oxoisovalerate dehydrogenase E2 component (dihydrolipoyl transacylase)
MKSTAVLILYFCFQVNIGADHRVLDGATVARFCNEWKKLIENPELLALHLR